MGYATTPGWTEVQQANWWARAVSTFFYTVDLLTDLLDTGTLTTADPEAHATITGGNAQELYVHLFKRPDGAQVLFVWVKTGNPTVKIRLKSRGTSAEHYSITGEATPYAGFDGQTLRGISLAPGNVGIYRINP